MYCKNCGKVLNPGERFCTNCGTKKENEIYQNEGNNAIPNSQAKTNNYNQNSQRINNLNQQDQYTQLKQPAKRKRNYLIIILATIGGIILSFIILFIAIFSITSANSNKLICNSSNGKITIMYNTKTITGYTASGMSFNLDSEKEHAKEIGIDNYIQEFSNWFKNNTGGNCTINGKEVTANKEESQTEDNKAATKVVGDDKYGYITIPENWYKFYDIDGNTSLQYSYASIYIVSINYFEDSQYTAKEYASNYMYNIQNASDVTDVTGATVQIGKNKEYTAYQVYMYYPASKTFLVTYWFEAEDKKVHYIALEGPAELNETKITDYLYIPESFSLIKK